MIYMRNIIRFNKVLSDCTILVVIKNIRKHYVDKFYKLLVIHYTSNIN